MYADAEHHRLRTAVFFLLIVATLFFYFLLRFVWSLISPPQLTDFNFIFSCTGAIILALAAIWGAETGLKRVWHSGRMITLDDAGIHAQNSPGESYSLRWDGHINQFCWRFPLKGYKRGGRERRMPETWICLAAQAQEAENRVIAFAYLSPNQSQAMAERYGRLQFHEINPVEVYSSDTRTRLSMPTRPDKIPADILAGKDGKYWFAEQRRWQEGFELSADDFETFILMVDSKQ